MAEDLWEFVPGEDDAEPAVEPSAEEAAIHVGQPGWREPAGLARVLDDPGRREVSVGNDDGDLPLAMWDDEDDGEGDRDGDRPLDVEELLERQHYAFAPTAESD